MERDWVTFSEAAEMLHNTSEMSLRASRDDIAHDVAEGKVFLLYKPYLANMNLLLKGWLTKKEKATPYFIAVAAKQISRTTQWRANPPVRHWKTSVEVAEKAGCTPVTVYHAIRDNLLKADKAGGIYLIHENNAEAWIASRL